MGLLTLNLPMGLSAFLRQDMYDPGHSRHLGGPGPPLDGFSASLPLHSNNFGFKNFLINVSLLRHWSI